MMRENGYEYTPIGEVISDLNSLKPKHRGNSNEV